ncbi:hypothetical protein FL622_02220 [Desulfuromonas acetexigens]|uniref:Uncharacterized protein n=1 Tax=Trichloromonas acetexigens TaxID=38815 RepID=A0A550JLC2_9BACT|nr:hypothetical protein FL622_02220 [Desulfuromonas acetexigens]
MVFRHPLKEAHGGASIPGIAGDIVELTGSPRRHEEPVGAAGALRMIFRHRREGFDHRLPLVAMKLFLRGIDEPGIAVLGLAVGRLGGIAEDRRGKQEKTKQKSEKDRSHDLHQGFKFIEKIQSL